MCSLPLTCVCRERQLNKLVLGWDQSNRSPIYRWCFKIKIVLQPHFHRYTRKFCRTMSISFVWPVACYALKKPKFFAFWCLWFYAPSKNFHSYEDVTITNEGLQILTYATHDSHGHPIRMIISISEDPWHTPIAERFEVELSLSVFTS